MCVNFVVYTKGRNVSRVFDNRVLQRIFQLKREKIKEGWRKFHSEEIYNLHSSPDLFK